VYKRQVLGYGGYRTEKGLLNSYIRYDTMFIAMQYLGMAMRGRPYMGVGRNLAYRKSLFLGSTGFSSHYHIPSGDDDLFVNANANSVNTAVETGSGSHTRSVPARSFKELFNQKQRHLSTAGMYRTGDKLMLVAEPVARILFYTSFILAMATNFLVPVMAGLFTVRLVTMGMVLSRASRRLEEKDIVILAFFLSWWHLSSTLFSILVLLRIKKKRSHGSKQRHI